MGTSTISNLGTSLKRVYTEKYFAAFQDEHTPILQELEEVGDDAPLGEGWFVEFNLMSPQNWKMGAEGQSNGTAYQRTAVQGQVNAIEFIGWFQISEMLKNAGKGAGAFGNELNRHMEETSKDIAKAMQRLFTISHGTGRLAIVESNTVGVNTFTAKNPEGVVALMEGDRIDIYDADTSGSSVITDRKITDINRVTRLVTFDGAPASLTADHGAYRAGAYGYAPNGLRGLIDDGTYMGSIHGQSRTSYPKLKSRVRTLNSGDALLEEHMRQICDDIYRVGGYTDRIFTNVGGLNAFFAITDGDRRYVMERGQTAQRVLGYKKSDPLFSYHDGNMPIKLNPNLPGREMYFCSWKKSMRQNTLRKLGWLEGTNGDVLHLTPGSGTYATSYIGIICAQKNISCMSPIWNGVIRNFKDKSVAGDE